MLILANLLLLILIVLGAYMVVLGHAAVEHLLTLITRTETLINLTERDVQLHDHARGLLRSGTGRDLIQQRLAARLHPHEVK